MKKVSRVLLFLLLVNSRFLTGQTAHVQFIHNSPDSSLTAIDIYIDGTKTFSNVKFRHATPFTLLPASNELSIGVAPANSTSVNDTIKNINITLVKDSFYYVMTSGLIDTTGYLHNSGGVPVNFAATVFTHASNTNPFNNYDCILQFFNGSPDAPLFNLYGREQRQILFSKVGYGQFAPNYKDEVTSQPVVIDLKDTNNANITSTYLANFMNLNLEGHSAIIFSSGFRNPSLNHNGPSFGLYAALYNGSVIPLIDTAIASMQLIHNSADTSLPALDIYVNGNYFTSYLFFRGATPYIDVPANAPLHIEIALAGSSSVADSIDSFSATFQNASSYAGILSGMLNTTGYKQNPDGRSIKLNLFNKSTARQIALDSSKVDFFLFNGSTDEPAIDVKQQGTSTLFANNIEYGDTSNYSELPPAPYIFEFTDSTGTDIIASYTADISLLKGRSLSIFTSGFLDTTGNHKGPSSGLFAALNDGNVIEFPQAHYYSRVQFIHNSADPTLSGVDIYINGSLAINDFGFRKATSFNGVPAGVTIDVGIAASSSTSASDTLKNFNVTLNPNSTNILMLNGLLQPTNFELNPDGKNTSLNITVIDSVKPRTTSKDTVAIRMVHASTDEPMNDFILDGLLPPLYDNIEYGAVKHYMSVSSSPHSLNMTDATNDNSIIRKYITPFSNYGGTALTVFSSGFLNPTSNQNGPAFRLFAADTSGNVFPLTDVTNVSDVNTGVQIGIYPNPASDNLIIRNYGNENIIISLFDITGKDIKEPGIVEHNDSRVIPLNNIHAGTYLLKIISNQGTEFRKLEIQR